MRKKLLLLILVVMFLGISYVNADEVNLNTDSINADEMLEQDHKKGQLIVIFKDNVSNNAINKVIESEDATCKDITLVDNSKAVLVEVSKTDTMTEAIEKFKGNKKVEYVQPNYRYSVKENNNDIYDPQPQYHLNNLNIKAAWNIVESSDYTTTKVAVIDTGVDVKHEDLQSNLVDNTKYPTIVNGTIKHRNYDLDDHGTHLSGIIGATYGNNLGVSGVASGTNNDLAKVMMIGASNDGQYFYTADIVDAINYAKDNGAKVVNMSFGGSGRDRVMEAAVVDAYDSGVVLVAASGNEESDEFYSPSDFKEVISVNASTKYNNPTYWSNYGIYKDILAPGSNILSTLPGSTYGFYSGTSMASPIVASVAALILDVNPTLTPAQVYNILCASTGTDGFDENNAYGLVNPKAAIEAARDAASSVAVTDVSIKSDSSEVYVGDDISLESLVKPATSLKKVVWSSENDTIASVDPDTGKVTGKKAGAVNIYATVDGKTATCNVKVKEPIKQESISIYEKEKYTLLAKGDTALLYAIITPYDATNQEVYWTTTNKNVVSIDEYGNITATGSGTATITAKNYNGELQDSVTITVLKDAKSVKITEQANKLLVNENYLYKASVLDENDNPAVINNNITWSSTNPSVAKVNKTTGMVTALSEGTTYIVASIKNSNNSLEVTATSKLLVGKTNYKYADYNLKISKKTYNSATLTWNKILVADKYIIERSDALDGPYTPIKTVKGTTTSYKDTNLIVGNTYYYRVKAVYNSEKSFGYSYKKKASIILNKPVISLNNKTKKTIKVSWKKVSGADGYKVYRSTSSAGTYKLLKTTTDLSYNNIKLKSGKKYYYKVVAYKKVNNKTVYSADSKVLNRVVK